jgi:hypothetical protein
LLNKVRKRETLIPEESEREGINWEEGCGLNGLSGQPLLPSLPLSGSPTGGGNCSGFIKDNIVFLL